MECNETLRDQIAARLAHFRLREATAPPARGAAVALVMTVEGWGADLPGLPVGDKWGSTAALILTRRASNLRSHAGQWALPGGRIDEGETITATALRELEEEVGLRLTPDAVLGRLDDFTTRSGFTISPVVLWAGSDCTLLANEREVESIHRIRITEFLRADAPMLEDGPEEGRPILRMPVGSSWIAAPTAAILLQFREVCLLGRDTRVAHYDQPAFAWR